MNALNDDHLDEAMLSALVDDQVEGDGSEQSDRNERSEHTLAVRAHVRQCADCERRLAELRHVVGLLHALPMHEPPRSFTLGPRRVADPPNVVRLQRWYAATRVVAASLAAVFVFLVAGTVYVDATTVRAPLVTAPSAAPASIPAPSPPAPAAAVQAATRPAAGARSAQSAPGGDSSDQVAATTSVRPLPTLPPTPAPTPAAVSTALQSSTLDPAAVWRDAASVAGVLAVLIVLLAVALRHRLRLARAAVILPLNLE